MKEKEINYVTPEVKVSGCAIEGVFCTSGSGIPPGNGTESIITVDEDWLIP